MIKRKTVLILGAGASAPYGFPCGARLKAEIIRDLESNRKPLRTAEDLLAEEFCQLFGDSPQKSIDGWLGKKANERFLGIGKRAIARVLLRYEVNQYLFRNIVLSHLPSSNFDDEPKLCWYRLLFDALDTTFERFQDNELSVITFNYDRSLEHFLFQGLKADNSDKSDKEIATKVNTIEIIHVHGQLGYLPWQENSWIVPYNGKNDQNSINTAVQHIQIIHEADETTPKFQRAQEIIKEAECIYFLGFGYNETNLRRLGGPDIFKFHNSILLGTGMTLSNTQLGMMRKHFSERWHDTDKIYLGPRPKFWEDCTCHDLIFNTVDLTA